MPEFRNDDIGQRTRRALDDTETESRGRGARGAPTRQRTAGRVVPVASALLAAAAVVAGLLVAAPHLHRTAVAVHPTRPSSAAAPTLLPTLASTPPPPSPLPTPVLTPNPTPTPVPWGAPPATVTEPQIFYAVTSESATNGGSMMHLAEVDWSGTIRGHLDIPAGGGYIDIPQQDPPTYLPSPDGSRVAIQGSKVVGPDGTTRQTLPAGIKALRWDDDNRHMCTLGGPGGTQLSWIGPGSSRTVATLTAPQGEFWWVLACDSARNRVVLLRLQSSPTGHNIVDLRSMEISTGHLVHDERIIRGSYAETSGDGTVVALTGDGAHSDFFDPDTGELVHTGNYVVVQMSWDGTRAAAWTGHCCNDLTEEVLDWRHDLPLYSRLQTSALDWYRPEQSEDMARFYDTATGAQEVDIIHPDGMSSTHPITSS